MKNIELFDQYFNAALSEEERKEFEARLKSDKEFSEDFKVYATTVVGICKEAEQDNLDFAHALKRLSKEDLRNIIGKNETKSKLELRPLRRERYLWIASMAAMVVIVFSISISIQRSVNRAYVDNLLVETYSMPSVSRSSSEDITMDIHTATERQVEELIPILQHDYSSATDEVGQQEIGFNLAMAYIKIHERKQAAALLNELKTKFPYDLEFVAKCEKILKHIQ